MASIVFSLVMQGISYLLRPKPPTIYGPRVEDLKVQASSYGVPLASIFGTTRLAGNVIWAENIKETKVVSKQKQRGKGGGKSTQTTITYTYSQSFAVGICEGPITGIRKIWANGELIYNNATSSDPNTALTSSQRAKGSRVYLGTEDQMPDSYMQTVLGIDNTPAYRGIAYIIFQDLQLAKFGNRTPNLEFEVVRSGALAPLLTNISTYTIPGDSSDFIILDRGKIVGKYHYTAINTFGGQYYLAIYDITNLLAPVLVSKLETESGIYSILDVNTSGSLTATIKLSGGIHIINTSSKYYPSLLSSIMYTPPYLHPKLAAFTGSNVFILWTSGYITTHDPTTGTLIDFSNQGIVTKPGKTLISNNGSEIVYIVCTSTTAGQKGLLTYSGLTLTGYTNIPVLDSIGEGQLVILDNYLYLHDRYGLHIFNISGDYASNPQYLGVASTVDTNAKSYNDFVISPELMKAYFANYASAGNTGTVDVFDVSNYTSFVYEGSTSAIGVRLQASSVALYGYGWANKNTVFKYTRNQLDQTGMATADVVTAICGRAGISAEDIDVLSLTSSVGGYAVVRSSIRSWLEPLMQAYLFDAVESDGKIKFVERGSIPTITIPEDDLGVKKYGDPLEDPVTRNRKEELELPVTVGVQYLDKDISHQTGVQLSKRYGFDGTSINVLNLGVSMSATEAKKVADVTLYDIWTNRTSLELKTGWKYAYLEASDVVEIEQGNKSYTVRLVEDDRDNIGLTGRRAVVEDPNIYLQNAVAPPMLPPDESVYGTTNTTLHLLDIPLLRDEDDGIGFYAAAAGEEEGWRGCQLYKSTDGGTTWLSFADSILKESIVGTVNKCPNYFGGNTFDELSCLEVTILRDSIESDSEVNVLAGANVVLAGNEIIQFKNAALIATNTYRLTGLLRGRRGTEWAMSTHSPGERFIVLDPYTTYIFSASSNEYNASRMYKAVTIGDYLESTTATSSFTHTAVSLKPYAPVELGGGRDASGNITIKWVSRTRTFGSWWDYTDVLDAETSVSFEVDIFTDSTYTTVKRTITGISTTSTTYSSANQVTDFGSNQSTIYVKVYKISSVVGRGFPLQGAI